MCCCCLGWLGRDTGDRGILGSVPRGSAGSAKVCLPQNSVDCVPEVDGFHCI